MNQQSYKPLKQIEKGSKGWGLKHIAQMTLGSGNMSLAVELPSGEELNEWLAVNTIEFYNEISILYGTLMEFCTQESCPIMSAGPKQKKQKQQNKKKKRYEYLWADGQNVKTPLKVSACEYIDYLMTWVEAQINNETLFPCQIGVPFPKNFLNVIKVIFKRLFRVYAHMYHSHFQHIMNLGLEYHLNTCFKHFIYFIDEFKLVDDKELAPLAELIQQFKARKENPQANQ
ncbi:mps one binder kinase activator-like 1b, putative [Ichthyophthirius multifiliis]|uniref:Mps one binder kinase activator-like 1b, putative n=1 Tax=Ichthyophthirius multifiliis TaxID=5932 RepID=G0QWA0_ICHMU|nr:mps one binder kinase activator-like 1b, putative [Ichthyophthirius multifiliis]EGR30523.1 mps one binder kinase activator-like 1b, putative [Ichthyophthirius multifiliis]|eukprot:XP_004032110.1 mps one binder kinase activator-like 1b, putative [Ichthyophthirius multifiliis]